MEDSGTARRQFRVLYGEFLFRLADRELLSAHTPGERTLIVQFASLLIFVSVLFSLPAWGFGTMQPPQVRLLYAWSLEHFFIATTMLVVGLFAVLTWDSLFPDRRDVLVLSQLPIRTRTIFLAKIAAVGSALVLAVGALHLTAGLVWPVRLGMSTSAFTIPAMTSEPAIPPVGLDGLQATLDRDLADSLHGDGALTPGHGGGLVVAVSINGERRILSYGDAAPDSLFEIGSITKTLTGTLLAHLVHDGTVQFDEPVRALLPTWSVGPPLRDSVEITLRDLATHHSGLPIMDPYYAGGDHVNRYAHYEAANLYWFLTFHGLHKQPPRQPFAYSNLGVGLLGHALDRRVGLSYALLLRRIITEPLRMTDTTITLTPDQQRRFIQGHDAMYQPMPRADVGVLVGAGAVISSASDMLTWLEANLAAEQTHTGPLAADLAMTHTLQADAGPGEQIGLGWMFDPAERLYHHDGATLGHTADAFFDPARGTAAIVLSNVSGFTSLGARQIGAHLRARLTGKPVVAIKDVVIPATGTLTGMMRLFAAYWITMFAAGAFVFCAVLCVQGLALQILPRRHFLRLSSWLQLGAFALIVGVYCLQAFVIAPGILVRAQQAGLFASLPSYWFLALFQALSGSAAMAPLVRSAWAGLAVVAAGAAILYALAYFRTVQRIVEEADILPGSPGARRLLAFGSPQATAIGQFSVRTLLRSPQHRVILAFFWGIGFALAIFLLKTPEGARAAADGPAVASGLWQDPSGPMLVSVFMMGLAVLGARVAFSLPRELRSNWIFRITPAEGGARFLAARRRALIVLSGLPVWAASAALLPLIWPWPMAAGHLIVLALVGMLLVELSLRQGAHKIPFTCAYLPGRANIPVVLWIGLMVVVPLTVKGVSLELQALQSTTASAVIVAILGLAWAMARWQTTRLAETEDVWPEFEDDLPDAVVALNVWDTRSVEGSSRAVPSP